MSAINLIPAFIQRSSCRDWQGLAILIVSMQYVLLAGCASWQVPAEFDVIALRDRAEAAEIRGVSLSAAVLSNDDSQRMFGADVNSTGVQPVWVEVENTTEQVLWLLRSGTDPDLFSPLEVAWSFHKSFAGETNASLDEHFDSLSFQNPIAPRSTQSGILFTNPHRKTRLLSVDILGQGQLFPFTLFPIVPDDDAGEARVIEKVWKLIESATDDYQHSEEFRARLEQLPCCARSADGTEAGDPINVILVGNFNDIATAFVRRGFRLNRLDFDEAQHLYGRPPDIVARKAGQAGVPANWLRMWVAPLRYRGESVLLVQAGRQQGWRYAVPEEKNLLLNPNVDEVRNLLIQDMFYSSGLGKIAFVTGVGETEADEMRASLGDTKYHTDGLRAVLFLVTRPMSLSDVEVLDWHPLMKLLEIEAEKVKENGD